VKAWTRWNRWSGLTRRRATYILSNRWKRTRDRSWFVANRSCRRIFTLRRRSPRTSGRRITWPRIPRTAERPTTCFFANTYLYTATIRQFVDSNKQHSSCSTRMCCHLVRCCDVALSRRTIDDNAVCLFRDSKLFFGDDQTVFGAFASKQKWLQSRFLHRIREIVNLSFAEQAVALTDLLRSAVAGTRASYMVSLFQRGHSGLAARRACCDSDFLRLEMYAFRSGRLRLSLAARPPVFTGQTEVFSARCTCKQYSVQCRRTVRIGISCFPTGNIAAISSSKVTLLTVFAVCWAN